jgi:cyclophilin family peptidyl-prolyl cis-trans isomerase/HEAT repeat protein
MLVAAIRAGRFAGPSSGAPATVLPVCVVVAALALGACQTPDGARGASIPDPANLEVRRAPAAAFVPAIEADDATIRARAALALGRLERLDAVPYVLDLVGDPDPGVRRMAAWAAGQLDLALSTSAHETARAQIERALVTRLDAEVDAGVRTVVVRALGQVASGPGLLRLVGLSQSAGPLRATALTALGVAGHRRGAPLAHDPGLRTAVVAGLADADSDVVIAAAYAAFRHQLELDLDILERGLAGPAQARLHLARAVARPETLPEVVRAAADALVLNDDWRVQVEAVRALRTHPDVDVAAVLELLPDAIRQIARPGQAHVVTEACLTLAVVGAPGPSLAVVERVVAGLPQGPTWTMTRCTCAGVIEILGGSGQALEHCTATSSSMTQRLLSIETIARARISSREKAGALKTFLSDDHAKLRVAVAGALCEDGSPAIADVAATRLLVEEDSGVLSTLFQCFADGRHRDLLKDTTLRIVADRLRERSGFEQLEPLITVATLARARPSPAMTALTRELGAHPDVAVREAAAGVVFGERAPGPRAIVLPSPSPSSLPTGAILRTTRGSIELVFERALAPRTVKTFVELANTGVLTNTPFHRVIPDFVAQGGDPRGDGSGGPGYTIPSEPHAGAFVRGAVGIATAGTDTGGSQFFLTHSDQPHLDGRYTLFATITDGHSVMDSLQREDLLLAVDLVGVPSSPTTPKP